MSFWHRLPKPIRVLAPMEEVTDTVFRRIVATAGRPDVFFTEFTSTDGLLSPGRESVIHRLEYTEQERPLVAQIWGNRPEKYYQACRQIREMGFDGIDINMGCPVKKIVKKGACSALIENRTLAAELIRAAQDGAGGLPLSVKTRLGFRKRRTEDWAEFLLALNPEVLIVHGRIAADQSEVPADWDEIGKVVQLRNRSGSKTLIIGNGDVTRAAEIEELPRKYGVDGVMVGRGIFRNLFLFQRGREVPEFRSLKVEEKLGWLLKHLDLFQRTWGKRKNFAVLKRFFKVYVSEFPGAAELRERLMETHSAGEAREQIRSWLEAHQTYLN